jgi:hypothetical protein
MCVEVDIDPEVLGDHEVQKSDRTCEQCQGRIFSFEVKPWKERRRSGLPWADQEKSAASTYL